MQVQIMVTIFGVLLIILVNWYFLFSKGKSSRASMEDSGIQEVKVVVKGGYSPDVIVVKRGAPVRINFYRDETAECSDTVVFGDFNVRKPLPAFRTTPVEFIPNKPGEYTFTCGMGMMKGRLIVE
jgi:plastocyanin domain-containing protein